MDRLENGAVIRCDHVGNVLEILFDRVDIADTVLIGEPFISVVVEGDRPLANAFITVAAEGAAFGYRMDIEKAGRRRRFCFDALVSGDGLLILAKLEPAGGRLPPVDIDSISALNNQLVNRQRDLVRTLMDVVRLAEASLEPGAKLHSQPTFTAAEREVIPLLLDGASNLMIASRLGIEVSAVKARLRTIFRKLEVASRGQAIKTLLSVPDAGSGKRYPILR